MSEPLSSQRAQCHFHMLLINMMEIDDLGRVGRGTAFAHAGVHQQVLAAFGGAPRRAKTGCVCKHDLGIFGGSIKKKCFSILQ